MENVFRLNELNQLNPCIIDSKNDIFHLVANPNTDFFCKYKGQLKDDASYFFLEKEGDFTLIGKIEVNGSSPFDALFLMVRESQTRWIKLALELGMDYKYNVISVVTDNWSDDAIGELISSNDSWLRITRKSEYWGLHYSINGISWRFVRAFGLKLNSKVQVGFGIQAPKSKSCHGVVGSINISDRSIENFRNGS